MYNTTNKNNDLASEKNFSLFFTSVWTKNHLFVITLWIIFVANNKHIDFTYFSYEESI